MNELPRVFANKIDKSFSNVQEIYRGNDERHEDKRNLSMKIKDIFSANNHVYKTRVRIKTKDGYLEKYVVGKTQNSLLTLDGKSIKLIDIYDIEKI